MHEQQLPLHTSAPDEQTTQAERSPAIHRTLRQERFERYQKRKADNTLRRQKIDLALFEAFLAEMGTPLQNLFSDPEAWKPITFPLVEHFLEWQLQKGYAIDSINIHLATVKKYAALACQVGVLSSDELFRIREVKGFRRVEGRRIDAKRSVTRVGAKKAAPTFLTEEQLTQLFQIPDLALPQGWRDLLLLRLLYDLGLRPSEVMSLQIAM